MQKAELEELMAECANDAVSAAAQEFETILDFSPESVAKVDDVLLSFIQKYRDRALEDDAVFTICNIYGAYIGETYRQIAGGVWRYDESNKKAPFVLLDVGERSYAFAGICYERLVNDSNVSVKAYFDQALAHQTQ